MSLIYINPYTFAAAAFLDSFPGAVAAYSLRNLSPSTTNVIKVRRSSGSPSEADFTAAEVSDGTLASWVGAGNNGFVTTWYDQSGNGKNATQATSANQPIIVSSGSVILINSKPAIEFDGSNDILVSSPTLTAAPQSNTFITVHNAKTLPSLGDAAFSFAAASTRFSGIILQENNGLQPAAVPRPAYPVSQSLFFYDQNTSADVLFLNGSNIVLIAGSQTNTTNVYSGNLDIGRRNVSSLYMDHYHQELIIYASSVRADRIAMESNINGYYSIY
jgi:hypothetical protein